MPYGEANQRPLISERNERGDSLLPKTSNLSRLLETVQYEQALDCHKISLSPLFHSIRLAESVFYYPWLGYSEGG